MTHSYFPLRHTLGVLTIMALITFAAESEAVTIQLSPVLPIPGDSVNVSVAVGSCVQFDRWERSANRIIAYTRRLNLSPCSDGGVAEMALGVLNAGFYSVEVFERSVDAALPPDGYMKIAEQRFSVAFGKPNVSTPTQIVLVGSMTSVQNYGDSTPVTFAVKDATGISLPDVPLGLSTAAAGARSRGYSCAVFAISNDCPAYQTDGNDGLTVFRSSPSDAEGAQVTTVIGTAIINKRALNAYATIGYIDALRRDSVVAVVEYEIDTSLTGLPTRYFLSANDAISLTLDGAPDAFRRTYAAFFGVKPNTSGAVPVCRFFANGKAGLSLTHVFTADASDCAAKKADVRYVDEGIAFWAYPASATGACARDTRGVTRYALTQGLNAGASNTWFRYSTLLSLKSRAALAEPSADGVTVKNDGVAFCVPD